MEPNARITQKKLAEKLQLSIATISRALSNSPLLPAETVRRVREEAKKLGYRPDPAFATLCAYRHAKRPVSLGSLIAWLGRQPPACMNDWDANVFRAAQKRGEDLGYKVDYFWINDPEIPIRRLEQILDARGVLGIVLGTQSRSHGHLRFSIKQCSAVAIGRTLHFPRIDQVAPDHFMALVTCYRKLLRLGYRRIGLAVSRAVNERSMGHWHAAYLLEQIRKKASPVLPILSNAEKDKRSLEKWLKKWKPDCVITALEDPFSGQRNRADQLEEFGQEIPSDIGLAVVNITETAHLSRFSGIVEPLSGIGVAAIDILVGRIRHNLRGIPEARTVSLIEGKWRDGETVKLKA